MGIPTVSVCMGFLPSAKMPVNITFAGKHGQDLELLKYAYAFEQQTQHRVEPPRTPALDSDVVGRQEAAGRSSLSTPVPKIRVLSKQRLDGNRIRITGTMEDAGHSGFKLEAFVDGRPVSEKHIHISDTDWNIETDSVPFKPTTPLYGGVGLVVGNFNVVLLARAGRSVAGKLVTIPQDS